MGQLYTTVGVAAGRGSLQPLAGRSERWPLEDGDAGTAATIQLIRRAWRDSQADPIVRAAAARILQGVRAHDPVAEARALFDWVLRNIRFTNDPVNVETISSAAWTLQNRIGDCDDINGVLLPSLLSIVGHRVRLVTISNVPAYPDLFSHIYCEANLNGSWVPMDAARSNAAFGVASPRFIRKRIWSLNDESFQDLAGAPPRGLAGCPVDRSGLGFSVSDFTKILQTGTDAAARLIAQLKNPGSYVPAYPAGGAAPGYTATAASWLSNPLVWLAGGLGAFLLLKKK